MTNAYQRLYDSVSIPADDLSAGLYSLFFKEVKYMWEWVQSAFNGFIALMNTFRLTDVLDIAAVSFIIYSVIKLVRETRAEQLVKGIIILIIAFALSFQFNLKMLSSLFSSFFQFSVLAVLILFQPELRRALEQMGRSKLGKYWTNLASTPAEEETVKHTRACIDSVVDVCDMFHKTKTGALIVFERQTKLGEIVNTGTVLNAIPSTPIIGNIFFNKAPLHDGAMVVRDGMVYAAGCILPLTKNDQVSIDLGTRHRAALGISEYSDAVIVIVSEETGTISIAVNGVLTRDYTKETLKGELEALLLPQPKSAEGKIPIISGLRRGRKNEKSEKKSEDD